MSIQDIFNYLSVDEHISTSGQPTAAQLTAAAQAGFQAVINLAPSNQERSLSNEDELANSLGMRYFHIPVLWDAPQDRDFVAFEQALKELLPGKTLIHCVANYRATAFYMLYAQKNLGWSAERAEAFRATIWQDSDYPAWEEFILRQRSKFAA